MLEEMAKEGGERVDVAVLDQGPALSLAELSRGRKGQRKGRGVAEFAFYDRQSERWKEEKQSASRTITDEKERKREGETSLRGWAVTRVRANRE